jgi:hypothetical protein
MVNPGTIAVFIGMLLFLFSLKLPYPVAKALDMTGAMTAPLAMLIVGSILAGVDFKSLFSGFPLYYGILVRNILLPLVRERRRLKSLSERNSPVHVYFAWTRIQQRIRADMMRFLRTFPSIKQIFWLERR